MNGDVPEVDARTGMELVGAGAVLLDVREDVEWVAGHAAEAHHIPLGRLADVLVEVPAGARVVVICRSGSRSMGATTALNRAGYDAVNLAGGMGAWVSAGGSIVNDAGAPGFIA